MWVVVFLPVVRFDESESESEVVVVLSHQVSGMLVRDSSRVVPIAWQWNVGRWGERVTSKL